MFVPCELQAFLICHFKTGASPKNGKPSETNLSRVSRGVQTRLICDNQKMPICSPQSSQCVYWMFAVEKMQFKHWCLYHLSESSRSWGLAGGFRRQLSFKSLNDQTNYDRWDLYNRVWMRRETAGPLDEVIVVLPVSHLSSSSSFPPTLSLSFLWARKP